MFNSKNAHSLMVLLIFYGTLCHASVPAPASFPQIWNVPPANAYFVGRQAMLENLHTRLHQGQPTVPIIGGAGLGKTQMAKRFAHQHKSDYDIVWWIDSEKNKPIDEQLKRLVREWHRLPAHAHKHIQPDLPTDQLIEQLKEQLRTTELSWLLIFDDVLDKNSIQDYLVESHRPGGRGHVLITSKNPVVWSHTMNITPLARNESIALLQRITDTTNSNAANELAETLGDFPLALVQAASYLKSHPSVTMEAYRTLFLTQRSELWKAEDPLPNQQDAFDGYRTTVATTLSMTLEEIKKESPHAADVLLLCAHVNAKQIPAGLLKRYLADTTKLTSFEQEEVLATLVKYGLLDYHSGHGTVQVKHLPEAVQRGFDTSFTLHEMTQWAVQYHATELQRKTNLQQGIHSLVQLLPDKLDLLLPLLEQAPYLLAHMRAMTDHATKVGIFHNDVTLLLIRQLEYHLAGQRDFATSETLINTIEAALAKTPEDPMTRCRFHLMKSMFCSEYRADYPATIREAQQALECLKPLGGSHPEEYLMAYSRLLFYTNRLGDIAQALHYAELGEALLANSSGFIGNQAAFYQGLATLYRNQGAWDKATEAVHHALALIKERGGNSLMGDWPIHFTEIALLVKQQCWFDAYEKAKDLFERGEKILPSQDHQYSAISRMFYGYSGWRKDPTSPDAPTHIAMLASSQAMMERCLGPKYSVSRMAALGHQFKGEIHEHTMQYDDAQWEYEEALRTLRASYQLPDPATSDLADILAKLALFHAKREKPETGQVYLTKLQQVFGFLHPTTTRVMDYYIEQSDPSPAR